MKLARASLTLGLAVLAAGTTSFVMADDLGWYGGADIGRSASKIDDPRITSGLLGAGFGPTVITDDDRATGYKIFGGYQLNRHIAVEGGYFDLGKFGFAASTVPPGTLNGNIKVRGLNLDLVGTLPVTGKFSAFGRIGVTYADSSDTFSGTGSVHVLNPNPRAREGGYKYGLGLQYAFTESVAMRAEAERYRINDAVGNKGDIDMVSVGLIYRFGAKPAAPVASAAPVYVAAAPVDAPAAVMQVAPVAAPLMKVTFSADSLFDFDKSSMKPAGRQAVDKFAADLHGVDFTLITVTGHTDRLGPHAYNLKLSARRADTVKAYLVASAGIAADKIEAKGVDGAQPVTKPGDCNGSKATTKLIACLQPDRRVDVEVSGSKQ